MMDTPVPQQSSIVKLAVREFIVPPITDALVLGKEAPIGCEAMRQALLLLHVSKFEHIEFDDDVISDILIRSNIVKKITRDSLVDLVKKHCKPLMSADEVLHLSVSWELFIEDVR